MLYQTCAISLRFKLYESVGKHSSLSSFSRTNNNVYVHRIKFQFIVLHSPENELVCWIICGNVFMLSPLHQGLHPPPSGDCLPSAKSFTERFCISSDSFSHKLVNARSPAQPKRPLSAHQFTACNWTPGHHINTCPRWPPWVPLH